MPQMNRVLGALLSLGVIVSGCDMPGGSSSAVQFGDFAGTSSAGASGVNPSGNTTPAPTSTTAPLGLNVDFNEQSLIDLIQPTTGLSAVSGNLTGDAQGWPKQDFIFTLDNRYTFAWLGGGQINIDPLQFSTDLSGAYTLSFTGQATIVPQDGITSSAPVYNSATNTTTANVTLPFTAGGGFYQIQFTSTKRLPGDTAGDGLTNVHLYRSGYSASSPSAMTTVWLQALQNYNWGALRFMGALGTNSYAQPGSNEAYPYLLNWDTDRTTPTTGPVYGVTHAGIHGVPYEYVIQAANQSNKDIWINVPVNASDAYVNAMANLFAQGLNSNINVYLEYSNEMWHLGFAQGPWNATSAQAEVTAGGSNLNYDNINNLDIWRFRRIAKRTVEIGEAFKTAFGSGAGRIRPVINNGWPAFNSDMLNYVTNNYGTPAKYLYGIAMNGYYSSSNWSSVSAIEQGEIASSNNNNLPLYIQNRTIATFYGLHSLIYEGGEGETGNPQANSPADPYLANKFAASRDSGMQQVMANDVLDNWLAAGGELYMHFSMVGRYSVYGFWGLTEDINNTSTPKWLGAKQILSSPLPAISKLNNLPAVSGGTISIPEKSPPSQVFAVEPQTPSALMNLQPWLEIPVQASVAGTYSIQLQAIQPSSGTVTVWVDNVQVGTATFGSSQVSGVDPRSNTLSFALAPGLHSIFVYTPVVAAYASQINAASGDTMVLSKLAP
jgi:hypothetical protein